MERVFRTLGFTFGEWLPLTAPVLRDVIALYFGTRKDQGAKRAAVQMEYKLWHEAALDICDRPIKTEWADGIFN